MCRTRRNKDGSVSKRKSWFRSKASRERFRRAMRNRRR